MTKKKKLYLVDIFSFIFRAYYAIRPLSTPDGTPANAVYGVVTMLKKLIDTDKPDHLIICADSKEKNFRYNIFPEYKANRGEAPEDLIPQIGLIEEFIKTYPMKLVRVDGYEADDILATLVKKYEKEKDMEIYIVSSDKDLMQLVSDEHHVYLYDTMKNKINKEEDVHKKFGVGPELVIDIQSLCGDAVDNIPGIKGVGPKTATKLINEYGSLEEVLNHADEIKGKLGEKVQTGIEDAKLSKKLVSLATDVPVEMTWKDMELKKPDISALNDFFKKMNFKRMIIEEGEEKSSKGKINKAKFITIQDEEKLKEVLSEYRKLKSVPFSIDTETDSLDPLSANLVGISFCFQKDKAYYIPISHKNCENLKIDLVREYLNPILGDEKHFIVGQNIKYDINVLSQYDFRFNNIQDDTLIMSYLINPDSAHNLDALAQRYLDHNTISFKDLVGKGQTFADVEIQKATEYAAEDAWVVFCLLDQMKKELKETGCEKIYHELEIPLVSVLANMEQNGILVDQEKLTILETEFQKRLKELEKKIYKLAEEDFNINSTKQLAEILFVKLGLPVQKKTKTGYSTDVSVLTKLAEIHDLPKCLLEFRMLSKLLSTYVIQLKDLINPKTKRIHTSFNQAIAATGRLSSSDPNLQNIPIRSTEGKRIREVFIAPRGKQLFSADYSQIELRLLAAFTKDKQLMAAYKEDRDIHAQTAASIFGLELNNVTADQRAMGKTINFGVIYGQSPFGLAKQLDVPQKEAKHFIDMFYKEFSEVKKYKDKVLDDARKNGYVSTYLGRKRFIPEIKSKNFLARQNAERIAFNTVFQGSAADLIKKAMIDCHDFLLKKKLETKMLLQVHDELILEVPNDEESIIEKEIPKIMESAFELEVPLKVGYNFAKNWSDAH